VKRDNHASRVTRTARCPGTRHAVRAARPCSPALRLAACRRGSSSGVLCFPPQPARVCGRDRAPGRSCCAQVREEDGRRKEGGRKEEGGRKGGREDSGSGWALGKREDLDEELRLDAARGLVLIGPSPSRTERIDFVDKDARRRVVARHVEQYAHLFVWHVCVSVSQEYRMCVCPRSVSHATPPSAPVRPRRCVSQTLRSLAILVGV